MDTTEQKQLVLVVDDSEDTLNLIRDVYAVTQPPFELITAQNAKAAIDLLNLKTFNAVILDVSLPDMTGAALGDIIRKENPSIPIAFLTNYNGPTTRSNAEDIGALFWYKPDLLGNYEVLMDKICELLSGTPCDDDTEEIKEPEEEKKRSYSIPSPLIKMLAFI